MGEPALPLGPVQPGRYTRSGSGRQIRYTVVRCKLGRLLVAGSEEGVCAVRFGDRDEETEASFRAEFRSAQLRRDDAGLRHWAQRIRGSAEGASAPIDLPVDVRATTFQARVWNELARIPRGDVRAYREIAAALEMPTASRAVAKACASNPVALVIPCHRAVRADGGLGGYRWGVARKRALLAQERADLDWV
jgi:AraC family transcriptional regulator of adaptative response/methylated-DNA-[protein]-cysteine methyltransferase